MREPSEHFSFEIKIGPVGSNPKQGKFQFLRVLLRGPEGPEIFLIIQAGCRDLSDCMYKIWLISDENKSHWDQSKIEKNCTLKTLNGKKKKKYGNVILGPTP